MASWPLHNILDERCLTERSPSVHAHGHHTVLLRDTSCLCHADAFCDIFSHRGSTEGYVGVCLRGGRKLRVAVVGGGPGGACAAETLAEAS
eukprot:5019960-Amphidinium_carterae.1